jgi:hypoxanthine phosphoribosyltransferase
MEKELKVLIKEEDLLARIEEMTQEINNFYGDEEELAVVCVLKGAILFFSHLVKHLEMPIKMEFIRLSSYGSSEKSCGKVTALDMVLPNFEDKNVLIVEDIIDTGLTIKFLKDYIESKCKAKSVKVASMINKETARINDMKPDFCGLDVDDKFIVGFGLDYDELYRNLPYIGYFE